MPHLGRCFKSSQEECNASWDTCNTRHHRPVAKAGVTILSTGIARWNNFCNCDGTLFLSDLFPSWTCRMFRIISQPEWLGSTKVTAASNMWRVRNNIAVLSKARQPFFFLPYFTVFFLFPQPFIKLLAFKPSLLIHHVILLLWDTQGHDFQGNFRGIH